MPASSASDTASSPSQIQCHRCKKLNDQDAQYCKHCGDLLGKRQCKKCKELNEREAKYCKQCGEQLQTLYTRFGPKAEKIKIILQMSVGVILIGFIIVYVPYLVYVAISHRPLTPLTDGSILKIVGIALAITTAFELDYTLFTDGPDEAVNPTITGIASGILLLISLNLDLSGAGAAVLTLALVVLFILREFFIEDKDWIDRIKRKLTSEAIKPDQS